jgi:hypothetical protein
MLEPVSTPAGKFRITMYNPDKLAEKHAPGRHQYLLCREAFEANVIINLPKLKMHGKAGITGSLKNLVGMNGNKDFLAHHRLGGTTWGGDCYPGMAPLKRIAEYCLDQANRRINTPGYHKWKRPAELLLLLQHRLTGDRQVEGMWYGNDTCWRMVLDLNRILMYGNADATMSDTPRTKLYTITDAIVAGEGDGPLSPSPVRIGAVTYSECAPAAEMIHAHLLGLDPQRIALLRHCADQFRWPLAHSHMQVRAQVRHEQLDAKPFAEKFGTHARPHRGWRHHCESTLSPN